MFNALSDNGVLVTYAAKGSVRRAMQAIADKYYVQIRGAHGEHTETTDGIFDISNLRRLGRNEVQLTQDMYNGVKEMMKAELAL